MVLLILTVVTTGLKIFSILKKHARDYVIRIMCGATYRRIYAELFAQLVIVDIFALTPALLIVLLNYNSVAGLAVAIAFGLVLNLLIMLVPLAKLRKQSLVSLTRSLE